MNKSQLIESILCLSALGLLTTHLPAHAQDTDVKTQNNALTATFLAVPANENVFILSANKICYGSKAPERAKQSIIVSSAGTISNVYPDQASCEAAGGAVSDEDRQAQAIDVVIANSKLASAVQQTHELALIQQTVEAMEKKHAETAKAEEQAQQKTDKKKQEDNVEKTNQKFYGINFGLGLAFVHMNEPFISDIELTALNKDDGTQNSVYVNHQSQNRAIAMLETHYFFEKSWLGNCVTRQELAQLPEKEVKQPLCSTTWGHGPFIAIGIAGDEGIDPLSTYGGGWMWGIKRNDGTSFNIGLGIYIDTKAKLLRPEYQDGMTTTVSDEKLLTYQRDKKGWMLMFSSTF